MSNLCLLHCDPFKYLMDKFQKLESSNPSRKIETMCILPGFIVMNNLKRKLSLSVQDFSNKIKLSTIEKIANEIVSHKMGKSPIIISDSARKQLILDFFERIEHNAIEVSESLNVLIKSIDIEDTDILNVLDQELDEYFRSCDSGNEESLLIELSSFIKSPFWKKKAEEILELFNLIHKDLLEEIQIVGEHTFLSRAHLVTEAHKILIDGNDEWKESYPNLKEICIMAITVFDSPTLHLISTISARYKNIKLKIFTGRGTKDHLLKRLEKAKIEFSIEEYKLSEETSFRDFFLLDSELKTDLKNRIKYISAPSPKKEIEEISIIIRRLMLLDNVKPKNIILVARNISKYKTYIENTFETAGIPYSIETRNPMAYSTVYRFLKATTDLLVKIEENEDIKYTDIMDPLRLGFCLPKRSTKTRYPINDKTFLALEESLDFLEQKHYSFNPTKRGLSLSHWKEEFRDLFSWMKEIIVEYIDWIESKTNLPDKVASNYTKILNSLIYFYIKNMRKVLFQSVSGPGIENARYQFFKYHPTSEANRIRDRISSIKSFLEYMDIRNEEENIRWKDVSRALGELVGGETYGVQNLDQNAIICIDAANIFFREQKYVFVLGMQTEEFPRKAPSSTFLQSEIKKEFERMKLEQAETNNNFAFLYNLSPENDYSSELDFFEVVLSSAKEELFLSRSYLDREGRKRGWSGFLDKVEILDDIERKIFPSEIFSFLSDERDDIEDLKLLSDKEILKLYNWILNRGNNDLFPRITKKLYSIVSSAKNSQVQEKELEDRIDRYLNPPKKINVNTNQLYLTGEMFSEIIDSPYRIHEITLAHECPLRFYFYQFYFNWFKGSEIEREIPPYTTRRLHYRYGFYPRILRKIFLRKTEEEQLYNMYQTRIPEREQIKDIDSTQLISQIFSRGIDFYVEKYLKVLESEKKILEYELDSKLKRTWKIIEEQNIQIADDIEIILPIHRLDEITITKENGSKHKFYLPVLHMNTSYALYEGFGGPRFEDFVKNSVKDLRLPLMHYFYADTKKESFFGTEFIEPFTGKRRGVFKQYVKTKYLYYNINSIYPKDVNERSVLIPIPMLKKTFVNKLRNTLEKTIEILQDAKKGVFDASKRTNKECIGCDYWRLCRGYAVEQNISEENIDE